MATLKELKDQILLAIYNLYKSGKSVSIMAKALCEKNNIAYSSTIQLTAALRSLVTSKYIKVKFVTGSNVGLITDITPEGIEYVEEFLGPPTKESSTDEPTPPDDGKATTHLNDDGQTLYKTAENYKDINDLKTEACFGVDALADCFIKQMDKIASHENENFCMLGIFAPWGRGKTYFFNKIKEKLSNRNDSIKYKTVEFNAWKYQDTPAIWAYLYEEIYRKTDRCQKVRLWWNRLLSSFPSWGNIAIFLLVVLVAWLIYFLTYKYIIKAPCIQKVLQEIQIPLIWVSLVMSVIYSFIKNPIPAYKYIIKHSQRKNYKSYLGIQNDLEKDLEVLLTKMITKPQEEQLLLYVDDIDRCSTDKMLEVINSLRIILENPEIQKRLIVICSIDPDKLISGYCTKKARGSNKKDYIEEAREHIDKLFIFGVGLAPLDLSQCQEYIQKIANMDSSENQIKQTILENDIHQTKLSNTTSDSDNLAQLTEADIYRHMDSFIRGCKGIEFTPRKLRIMYYRLLFANNLTATKDTTISESMMNNILSKSIYPDTKIDNTTADADIVNTVVPY